MKSLGEDYWLQALQLWDWAQIENNFCPDQLIVVDDNNNFL